MPVIYVSLVKFNRPSFTSLLVWQPKSYHCIWYCTVHRKVFWGKLAYLANHELFAKIFSPIFTDTLKMYLASALTVAYLPNFSSPIALPVWFTNISPAKYFLYMVCDWQSWGCTCKSNYSTMQKVNEAFATGSHLLSYNAFVVLCGTCLQYINFIILHELLTLIGRASFFLSVSSQLVCASCGVSGSCSVCIDCTLAGFKSPLGWHSFLCSKSCYRLCRQ